MRPSRWFAVVRIENRVLQLCIRMLRPLLLDRLAASGLHCRHGLKEPAYLTIERRLRLEYYSWQSLWCHLRSILQQRFLDMTSQP